MAKGTHYFADGRAYKGEVHKMRNGQIHTGAEHSKSSKRVYEKSQLAKAIRKKIGN
jgi:hypothetical protein